MDVSSANSLHKPIVSSAISLINTKKRRVQGWNPDNYLTIGEDFL
jgi:hypothetical protein